MNKLLALLRSVSIGIETLVQRLVRSNEPIIRATVTRQRIWQLKQRSLGLCEQCSRPAQEGVRLCSPHLITKRLAARVTYRKTHDPVASYQERAFTKVYKPRK